MVFNTDTNVALCCPECGRLGLYVLSRFLFNSEKTRQIRCPCGTLVATVTASGKKGFRMDVNCIICEGDHTYHLSPRELWTKDIFHLFCLETGLEVGHTGPKSRVKEYLKSQQTAMATLVDEMGGEDYFRNVETMLSALSFIHNLAEDGNLSCPCGRNRIELEIFPERIELHCRHCKRVKVFKAESEQDVAALRSFKHIELTWPGKPDGSEQVSGEHDNR